MMEQTLITHEEAVMRLYCLKLVKLGIHDQDTLEYLQWSPAHGDHWVNCKVNFWHETMNQTYPTFTIEGTSQRLLLPLSGLMKVRLRDGSEIKFNGIDVMDFGYKSELRLCVNEGDDIGMPVSVPIISMHNTIRETLLPMAHADAQQKSPGHYTTIIRGVFFCPGIKHPDGNRKVLLILQLSSDGVPDYMHHFEERFYDLFVSTYKGWERFEQKATPT